MNPSAGDFLRLHFSSLDAFDLAELAVGALMLASVVLGTIALLRVRREVGERRSLLALRRWIGATTALALLSCVVAVAATAWHQWVGHAIVAHFGWNTTPGDLAGPLIDANLALASGLVIGAVGLALGWTLEWFADGLAESADGET